MSDTDETPEPEHPAAEASGEQATAAPEVQESQTAEAQTAEAKPAFWRDATLQRVVAIFALVLLVASSGFFVWAAINVAPYQADAIMKSDREVSRVQEQIADIDSLEQRLEACAANFAEIRAIMPGIQENLSVIAQEAQGAFSRGVDGLNVDRYIAALDAMVPLSEQAYAAYDRSCDE